MIISLSNILNYLVGKIRNFGKRNYVSYIYHIVVPFQKTSKINECFINVSNKKNKPFEIMLASKGSKHTTHAAAFFLSEEELNIFEIVCSIDSEGIFWWKVEKETNKLDDCNEADCFVYIGEVVDINKMIKKAGFVIVNKEF